MRVVCSFCHAFLRDVPGAAGVSHGMCPSCAEFFGRLWEGMPLGEYLDDLAAPVLVVDPEHRVLAANARMAEALGRDPRELRGALVGEAMACSHARLPEGCGKTIHCRECTIRREVAEVAASGRPVPAARAYLATDAGRVELEISARPVAGGVEVTIAGLPPADGSDR